MDEHNKRAERERKREKERKREREREKGENIRGKTRPKKWRDIIRVREMTGARAEVEGFGKLKKKLAVHTSSSE